MTAATTSAPTEADPTSVAADGRGGRLRIDARLPLHQRTDAAVAALARGNDPDEPEAMVRGNELVRMTERGAIEPLVIASLRKRLSEVSELGRHDQDEWKPIDPPRDLAETVLACDSSEYPGLPRVDRVVDVPVLSRDGTIISRPGHHPSGNLFYRPARGLENLRPPRPGAVSEEEADAARDLLLTELLGDFGFADESSRAHALALLLTPFVREYVDGPTPLFVVHAHAPGWGKGTLTDAALIPGCGSVPKTPGARDEDEWRKRITSALVGAPNAVVFDNLGERLDSQALAQAISESPWSDRVLGGSVNFVGEVRNVWTANGNNIGLSNELADRSVPILLGPTAHEAGPVAAPRMRDRSSWRHPDLARWARDRRAALAGAALALIQHWLDGPVVQRYRGSEMRDPDLRVYPERSMGTFDDWASVVGGVLRAAGVEGFLENRESLSSQLADEDDGAGAFFAAWAALDLSPSLSRELATLCSFNGALHAYVPDELHGSRAMAKDLGFWLRAHRGRWIGGHRLMCEGSGTNARRWYLVGPGQGTADEAPSR